MTLNEMRSARPPWALSSRLSSYLALFAYSLVHPGQFAQWADGKWKISATIDEATYAEVRREWAAAAKSRVHHASTVTKLFLSAPQSPEERAREALLQPIPVHGPPKDG